MEDREHGCPRDSAQILCLEIIALCQISSDTVIEMSKDHTVTMEKTTRHELFRRCTFRGMFARRSGWMEITWTSMEGPVRRRLWTEFRISSYVFRKAGVSVCYCVCVWVHWRTCKGPRTGIKLRIHKYIYSS